MNTEVIKQEIEIRVREWKIQHDAADQLTHELGKAVILRDNTAGIIEGKMRQLGVEVFKTPYGAVSLSDGILALSNHPARLETKKKGKKDVLEA